MSRAESPDRSLDKCHSEILVETVEAGDFEVSLLKDHAPTKRVHRHEVHDLLKYQPFGIHKRPHPEYFQEDAQKADL